MAYKITNAKFINNKIELRSFNLDTSNYLINQLHHKNSQEKRLLTRILKGKEQIRTGRFLIDNMDLVNPSFVKSRTAFIKGDNYFERFIPAKFVLSFTTLLNPRFFRDARMVSITNQYNYEDFKKSGTNLTVATLKKQLEDIVVDHINSERTAEKNKIRDFNDRLLEFNERKANELDKYKDIVLKVVSKSYFDEMVTLNNYGLMMHFLQTLYDDVYNYLNLRHSCTCEYNVKHSSNKILKRSIGELKYREPKYVVRKQLKYIGTRITELRFKIARQRRLVQQLKKQLNMEIEKQKQEDDKFNKSELTTFLNSWKQLLEDQFEIFAQKQKNYFVEVLSKKGFIIAKTLVIYIHTYHQKVIAQEIEFETIDDYKQQKKVMKSRIVSIWKQAIDYNRKQLEDYDIKIDWFLKSTFKMSSLNIVYLKILRSINLRKKNIVLTDFIKLLNYSDFEKLLSVIKKIKEKNPEYSFVMMQSQIEKFPFLNQPIYSFKDNEFKEVILREEINNNYLTFQKEIFSNFSIKYNYRNKRLIINKKKYLWDKEMQPKKTGSLFINPFSFEINFEEPFGNGKVNLLVYKKHASNFNDQEMFYGKGINGTRIYFYNNDSQIEINKIDKLWLSFSLKDIMVDIEERNENTKQTDEKTLVETRTGQPTSDKKTVGEKD